MGDSRARPGPGRSRAATGPHRRSSAEATNRHHGCRRQGLPQLQSRLPGARRLRGRRLHGDADPRHRGARVPRGARGRALPQGHPHPRGGRPPDDRRRARRQRDRVRVQRRVARVRHAPGIARERARGGLHAPRRRGDDARREEARRGRVRRAHGERQEPDHAERRGAPDIARQARRRREAPDAVRRPQTAGLPAVRRVRRHDQAPMHDRGDGGVRRAHREGHGGVRRRGLREDPRGGREGGGRRPLGRRQQRHILLHPGRPDRRRGPAPCGSRAHVLPGRAEPAHGRRRAHQQGRHGEAGGRGAAHEEHRLGEPAAPWSSTRSRR